MLYTRNYLCFETASNYFFLDKEINFKENLKKTQLQIFMIVCSSNNMNMYAIQNNYL